MNPLHQLIKNHLKTQNIALTPNYQPKTNTYTIHHWPPNDDWKTATIHITTQTTTLWKTGHPQTALNTNDPQLLDKITQWTQQHLTN